MKLQSCSFLIETISTQNLHVWAVDAYLVS
jgi:hypothetical protein